MKPRVRFAPSPTGEPHLGFARTALYNFLFAKSRGGKFLLRIEDTDQERSKKDYQEKMLSALRWLGLVWDEEVVYQSKRSAIYSKYIQLLLETGKAYRCFASKDELQKIRKETNSYLYNGMWRNKPGEEVKAQLEKDTTFTVRLKTPRSGRSYFEDIIYGDIKVLNDEVDDFIIVRSDGSPVYNLTNVIDDNHMKISHVIRGEDHLSNTIKQLFIYKALNLHMPQFAHLPMILGEDRKRLSKRHGATGLSSYRDEGYQPEAIINYLAYLGWNPGTNEEIMDLPKLVSKFDLSRVQKKSAIFDLKKLNWISSQHLVAQANKEIFNSVRVLHPNWGVTRSDNYCLKVIKLLKPRSDTISKLVDLSDYFFSDPKKFFDKGIEVVLDRDTEQIMSDLLKILENAKEKEENYIEKEIGLYIKQKEMSFGQVIKPLRLAICGNTNGPSIYDILELVGIETSANRLKYAIEALRYD